MVSRWRVPLAMHLATILTLVLTSCLPPAAPTIWVGAGSKLSPDPGLTSALALPDLVVTSMRIELQTGGACNFPSTALGVRVVIANIGDAPAGPFSVDVDGARQRIDGLAVGQSTSLWFAGYQNTVTATVDPLNEVVESNEGNNQLSQMVP